MSQIYLCAKTQIGKGFNQNIDSNKKNNPLEKFGFKSLFTNESYQQGIPYSAQVNPEALIFVKDYLQKYGTHLKNMKRSSAMYFLMIEKILALHRLPKELKYLAVIESNLKNNATSWAGAKGPWQFMPGTAIMYGLQVNNYIDERTDYIKSTHAAAKYLYNLYNELNDWMLVIAAYNGGPARVYTAIKKSGSRDFWKLQQYLPAESRNHVKKFIATHYIMEGKDMNETMNEMEEEIVYNDSTLKKEMISGRFAASVIVKNIAMDAVEFNNLNPGLDASLTSGSKEYELRLPAEKMELFRSKKQMILQESIDAMLNGSSITNSTSAYPVIDKLPVSKKTKKKKN